MANRALETAGLPPAWGASGQPTTTPDRAAMTHEDGSGSGLLRMAGRGGAKTSSSILLEVSYTQQTLD